MVRLKPFTLVALLLVPALVLLVLTIISTPITRFSSLGSVNGVKFGVFGYCYDNGTCSDIQIGYNIDTVLSGNTSTYSKRFYDLDSKSHTLGNSGARLTRRQNGNGNGGNNNNNANNPGMFNLSSSARNGLANVLIIHVIAAGFTLILLVMALIGHLSGPSQSAAYMLAVIIISVLTVVLTLFCFLMDILIFVPNLDWGTWVALGATVLITVASILTCTARRTLKTRRAMRKRIAENDDMNAQSYYNAEHLQDSQAPITPPEPVMTETDKATLPRFAQYDYEHPDSVDQETQPLNMREVDARSVRSETPSLTSPPKYPVPGIAYSNMHEMQSLQPTIDRPEEYANPRIPYGRPPRQDRSRTRGDRAPYRDQSYESLNSAGGLEPPLAHAREPVLSDNGYSNSAGWNDSQAQTGATVGREENGGWPRPRQAPPGNRGGRQRVVSGPRPMPGVSSNPDLLDSRRAVARSPSGGGYYEDVAPQFDEDDFPEPRPAYGSRRHTPQGSGSFDRPQYPQQPRSPDTLSNSSHFTSVSQRGINPAWRGDAAQQQQAYGGGSMHYGNRGPRQDRPRGPPKPNILADNPDFVLPGATPTGNRRLPGSRRPNNLPGLASALGAGASPYAITKAA